MYKYAHSPNEKVVRLGDKERLKLVPFRLEPQLIAAYLPMPLLSFITNGLVEYRGYSTVPPSSLHISEGHLEELLIIRMSLYCRHTLYPVFNVLQSALTAFSKYTMQ